MSPRKKKPHYVVLELMDCNGGCSPSVLGATFNEWYEDGYRVAMWSWDIELREACFVLLELRDLQEEKG